MLKWSEECRCMSAVRLDHFRCVSCHSHSSLLFLSGSPTGVKKMLLALTLYHLFHHGQQSVEDIEAVERKKNKSTCPNSRPGSSIGG